RLTSTKSPRDRSRGRWPRIDLNYCVSVSLRGDVAADDLAEQFPLLALEELHLELGNRREIGRAGVDLDAWQQRVRREVLQVRGLLHEIGAGEIVAAHFQNLGQG